MDWVRRRWATRRNWRAKRVSLTRRRIRTFLATFVVYLFWYKLAKPVDVQLTVLKDQGEYAHNIKCMPDVPVFVLGLDKDASLSGAQSFWQGGCVQFVQAVNSSRIILSEMKSLGTVDAAFDMKRSERLRRFGVVLAQSRTPSQFPAHYPIDVFGNTWYRTGLQR